jgi:FtsP/CotA-like multicopper oxidase with cupredoxin domain
MASMSINMGSTLTYYYKVPDPGTYMYHCHVEASEHMQMGMLGNLYVLSKQDGTTVGGCASQKYAYTDGDGSTCYDVDFPIQVAAFDPDFHNASISIQPLPFALMTDTFPMLNGRGYPDTVNTAVFNNSFTGTTTGGKPSQKENALITATQGQKILLRISSLSTIEFHTLRTLGIPMKVVGRDARILRSSTGQNLFYNTHSVTLGGGESVDVILDTADIDPGTYFLYTTNLNHLSNDQEDFGGMMTEIRIN